MGVPADARHSRRARQPAPSARGSDPRRKRDQAARSASVNRAAAVEPGPWCPRSYTAFKILLIVRLSSGLWSHIGDCDETYNYWEPLHFFLYGRGFQTWEHSPEYALRSYTYILLHLVPAWLYEKLLNPPPVYVFFFVRCILALVCTGAEVYWLRGIRQQIGPNVARLTLAILVGSAGMFVAGCALLPASTSMWLSMMAMGAWAQGHYPLAIFCTAGSTFLSWPFAAILGLPIALDVLVRRRRWSLFVVWSAISTVVLLVPQIGLDSAYYGRSVVAPWNIISYNIFTSHGPDLYGVADLRFYLINASLNFNIAFPLSLVSGPCLLLTYGWANKNSPSTNLASRLLQLMGFYVWILIFFNQPHKEERFLYPIYPLIAFGAATTIDCLEKVAGQWVFNVKKGHYTDHTSQGSAVMVICIMLLGLSRSVALYKNYGGSFNAWLQISHLPFEAPDVEESMTTYTQVCVGKEWHRFPSSFFLPSKHWAMRFIRSEFRGQLPATYSSHVNGTYETRNKFNDLNQEEMDRIETLSEISYIKMTIKSMDSEVSNPERMWSTLHKRSRRAVSARGSRDSHSFYEKNPPVPTVTEHIATPMRHRRKNHVQENILFVMRSKPFEQHDPRIVDSVNGSSQSVLNSGLVSTYSKKKCFGKIPNYIKKHAKDQRERINAMEMEAQRRMEREANCFLSLDHRSSILQGLQKNWSLHQHQFLGLSLFGDTPHEKRRQDIIQSHLMELERYIDILKSFPTITILD